MQGFLTPEQRSELLHELKVEHHAKYSDRIKTILLLDDGEKHADIAKFLFLDEGTIRNYQGQPELTLHQYTSKSINPPFLGLR